MEERTTLLGTVAKELNVSAACRRWGVPFWQCPEVIFIGIGFSAVTVIFGSYLVGQQRLEPEQMVALASALAMMFLAASFIIVNSFERIAEVNRLKSEFINITSHQLRSPLTAARWALSLFQAGIPELSPENHRYLVIIEESIGRMRRMVATMLEVARIEAGTLKSASHRLSLGTLVQSATNSFSDFARASNIAMRFAPAQDALEVICDEEQLRYVVEGLLDNALRYTPGKGAVAVSLSKEGQHARVTVSDTGTGIPHHDQQKVFEKFFRAGNVFRISPGGMGLSLFVARAIVEAHGGTMGFISQEQGGTTFWFTIPLAPHDEVQDA